MSPLTLVVPCFNEAARLDEARWLAGVDAYEWLSLLFVDDGSTDGTAGMLGRMADARPGRVRAMSLDTNQGKAEAVRRGMLAAIEAGAPVTGYWDADLATPVDAIPALLSILADEPDVVLVMGARVRMMGWDIRRVGRRHYAGRVFASMASVALGVPVYDTQCGAKLLRAGPAARRALGEAFSSRWVFDVQLLARLIAQVGPWSVREVPLRAWRDVAGSKITWGALGSVATDLVRMRGDLGRARRRGDG